MNLEQGEFSRPVSPMEDVPGDRGGCFRPDSGSLPVRLTSLVQLQSGPAGGFL
jgi:hypothetical protein